MRFLGLMRADENQAGEPDPSLFEEMANFVEEATNAGVLLASDGLQPTALGKRLKLENGKLTVTDGPFTETKEVIASYALMEAESMDELIPWVTRFLEVIGGGDVELRPIFDAMDLPDEVFPPEAKAREQAIRQQMTRNMQG